MLSAISRAEFLQAFHACRPPNGWGKSLTVAFSGGPDSTCLLFLLRWALTSQSREIGEALPVLAVSVDHGLQAASSSMAEHCARFALEHGIRHVTLTIPWGTFPYPTQPASHEPFEKIARDARSRLILNCMEQTSSSALLTGHHADDQVETLIMGQLRSPTSMNTMQPCRLWGMGNALSGLGFTGLSGMDKWVARPLLAFSKDRILATCDAHGLQYVVDKTNFQPSLTPRNAIREVLRTEAHRSASDLLRTAAVEEVSQTVRLPEDTHIKMAVDKRSIHAAIRRLLLKHQVATISSLNKSVSETLADISKMLVASRLELDKKALDYLRDNVHPSPASTFSLVHRSGDLPGLQLRRSIILRIIRYVSPFPWGSTASQAHREARTIDRLAATLWNRPHPAKCITHGGLVQWTPVIVRSTGKIKLATPNRELKPGDAAGWIASRQPGPVGRDGAIDVTDAIITAWKTTPPLASVDFLFDCRFSVRILLAALPQEYKSALLAGHARLSLVPRGPYCIPALVWKEKAEWPKDLPQILRESDTESQLWSSTPVRVL